MNRLAKIVATVGPASSDESTLARLLDTGVDVVRLNLSHGNQESHRQVIRTVRRLAREQGRFVPVFADLMGPRFRLGQIADGPRILEAGQEVRLGADGPGIELPVEDPGFLDHLRPGERVLIDNGLVELEVLAEDAGHRLARVLHGGPVSTRKGINLPDTDLPFTISEKDRADIAFALREGADYVAVSFVGGPGDLKAVRAVMREHDGMLPLIAKLERAKALERLDAIVRASDAVMVARGDLGVEVPLHQVPVLQKKIIAAGARYGKPVIVATQMLESMMEQPRPTRAEVSDCANAVFDGADALMLSGETAAGKFPVEAVRTMAEAIVEAEGYEASRTSANPGAAESTPAPQPDDSALGTQHLAPGQLERQDLHPERDRHLEIPDVVSAAAVEAANLLQAKQIVAFSQGGFTARMLSRYRPKTPITVFTRSQAVARKVQLVWGTRPLLMDHDVDHHDEVVSVVDHLLLENGLAQPGDVVIILMGDPIAERPLTNLMRVHRLSPG